jgi:hypothetical protein
MTSTGQNGSPREVHDRPKGITSGSTQTTTPHPNASVRTEKWVNRNPAGRRKQTGAVRSTHSRPKYGREMGQRGQASGPRKRPRVHPRVRPTSPGSQTASSRLLHRGYWPVCAAALASSSASSAGYSCRSLPSAPAINVDDSMTVLGGKRPAARVQRLYKAGPHTPWPHTPAGAALPQPTSTP